MTPRRDGWKPILALMILAPLLAEVFSGSMPATAFLQPQTFFPFVIVIYGLPVLVLREVAVRRRYGLLGLCLLGFVYGLYNEGLFSETLYYPLDPANEAYADYGLVAGLRVPWASYILPWHGLFSMLTPVLVVELLFPRWAGRPWLPASATWILGIVTAGLALARFLLEGEDRGAQDAATFAVHLAAVLAAAVILWVVAGRLPRTPATGSAAALSWRGVAAGAGTYAAVFLGTEILTSVVRAPWPLTVLYALLTVSATAWAAARRPTVARAGAVAFVLGCGLAQAVVVVLVVGVVTGDGFRAVSGAVAAVIYLAALTGVRVRYGHSTRTPMG
ncbi:hypothetical protein FH608_042235 [Nonomuraea phyllanthi]|uniref:Uncharacterized protein n=1 Tax=Nonomuraea phyllanthi TaxID=2219224 RepID=A0A5C4VHS8_9ACTN|nr:hypothetical protein [Nonomuraea phyllanthi]KAB8189077.1 hypothetical protein FH608_042235 [Nonomuraea phyllanthi]